MKYRVLLEPSEEGFAVSVPTLPGCHSQGATEQEALDNISDAIREYLEAVDQEITVEVLSQAKKPDSFLDVAASLKLEGPPDWARNIDKYLYGDPHRTKESGGGQYGCSGPLEWKESRAKANYDSTS